MLNLPASVPRCILAHTRRASSFAHQHHHGHLEYPSNSHPTPYQIFHLPHDATQRDIKTRYYDLVRIYHPDSPFCREDSPEKRHTRFQAITAAYDALRGRHPFAHSDPIRAELERRRRSMEARRQYERPRSRSHSMYSEFLATEPKEKDEDAEKDLVMVCMGLLLVGIGLIPFFWGSVSSRGSHLAAASNLAQARREAREYGHERRQEIHRRVQEFKEQQEQERSDEQRGS